MRKNILLISAAMLVVVIAAVAQQKKLAGNYKQPGVKASIEAGKLVYGQYCLTCHQADGGGVQNMNPTLINTSYVIGDKGNLVSVLLNGLSHVEIDGETYSNVMPSFSYLKDKQIADVLSYVRNSFGNKRSMVSAADVKAGRARIKK